MAFEQNMLFVASPCLAESVDMSMYVDCMDSMQNSSSSVTTLDPADPTVQVSLPPLLQSHPTMAYIYLCIVTLASSVGTVGNSLIVAAFFMSRSVRSSGNEFLLNLAFADLCVTMIADPMCIIGKVFSFILSNKYKLILLSTDDNDNDLFYQYTHVKYFTY